MKLVDRHILSCAIDFACASMDDSFNSILKCCLTDIECSFDIGVDIALRSDIRVGDSNERGKMEDDIYIFADCLAKVWLTDISTDDFNIF